MEKGYGTIPKLVMQDKDLDVVAKAFYAYLCSYTGRGDTAFPSLERICNDLNISRQRLERHRRALIERGYISISQEKGANGKFKRNVYKINMFVPLLQIVTSQKPTTENITLNNNSSFNNNNIKKNNNNSKVKTSEKVKKTYDIDSDEYKLVMLFIKKMKEYTNDIFEGPKNLDKWCDAMRLLIDITLKNVSEERTLRCKKAQDIILYVVEDDFHRGNVLSIPKLRTRALEFIVKMDAMEKKKQGYNSYNNNNTQQSQTAIYQKEVKVEDLYSGGEWE